MESWDHRATRYFTQGRNNEAPSGDHGWMPRGHPSGAQESSPRLPTRPSNLAWNGIVWCFIYNTPISCNFFIWTWCQNFISSFSRYRVTLGRAFDIKFWSALFICTDFVLLTWLLEVNWHFQCHANDPNLVSIKCCSCQWWFSFM